MDVAPPDKRTDFGPHGLKSIFAGEHAWCGEKMMLSADLPDAMPLTDFFGSGAFAQAIDTYGEIYKSKDRRAVASMWSLYYFSALTIPYIVARRAHHDLPVSMERMTIALADDGLPRAFGLADDGDWADEVDQGLLAFVTPLVRQHLSAIVAELKAQGGIAPKLAWNNAAVYIDYAFNATDNAGATQDDVAPWASRPLFDCPLLPDGASNPFLGCLRHETDNGQTVCRRKVCCLRYMLPGVASCGELCALPAQRKQ